MSGYVGLDVLAVGAHPDDVEIACGKSGRSGLLDDELADSLGGKPFEMLRKTRKGSPVVRMGLSMEEKALLKFLRETIADRRIKATAKQMGSIEPDHKRGCYCYECGDWELVSPSGEGEYNPWSDGAPFLASNSMPASHL